MVKLARVVLLICCLTMLPNLASAEILLAEKPLAKKGINKQLNHSKASENVPVRNKTKEYKSTKIPEHTVTEHQIDNTDAENTEAEILQSLDNLNQQSNNEIFLVESQTPSLKESNKPHINDNEKKSDEHTKGEDMMLNDGFDELDLAEVFTDLEFKDVNNMNHAEKIKNSNRKSNTEVKYGVGVAGEEAELINKLDHSDLIDFENEVDIWSKKVVKNKKNDNNNKR